MKRLNQKGFTGIEIALTVIVLALVGGSSYMVYQRQQDKKQQETLQQQIDDLKKSENKKEDSAEKQDQTSSQTEDEKILAAIKLDNGAGGFETCKTEGVNCVIKQKNEKLAYVGWGYTGGGGAGIYLQKQGQDWVVIHHGNDSVPEYIVQKYDIPESWLGPQCTDCTQ